MVATIALSDWILIKTDIITQIADLFIREPSQRRWYLSKHVVGWVGSP